jgi:glucosylceramidase
MKKYLKTALVSIIVPLVLFGCITNCSKSKSGSDTAPPPSNPPTSPPPAPITSDVALWLTRADQSVRFQKQGTTIGFTTTANGNPTISVDTTQTYQTIDGFGFCLTGGSATLINRLPVGEKDALLKELFLADSTFIGTSYLRVSIGASDLSASSFTYNDLSAGQTDTAMQYFNLDPDRADVIPVLKQILALSPQIKILGSPWSAPTWMKTNGSFIGGSLKPEYYGAYARYFVKYIQSMKTEGIRIDAITLQNEPMNPHNNPSMLMTAAEQAAFVKNNLGPAFAAAGLDTKIIVFDHNCDTPEYPRNVLSDADAAKYIDGSAFHLYAGDIRAMSQVHSFYPSKNIYFTEQWVGGPSNFGGDLNWHVKNLIIGATRNWSRNVLEWNLAADDGYQPHTPGGCSNCLGAITIGGIVSRNVAYYIIAHASKFVRPGSIRIGSNEIGTLPNVAFKTPGGKKVLIVLNDGSSTQNFNIQFNGKIAAVSLDKGSVGTFIW